MKTQKIVFGVAPILMQRWDGGPRIIMPDGAVAWGPVFYDYPDTYYNEAIPNRIEEMIDSTNGRIPCTQRTSQKESFLAAAQYDEKCAARNRHKNYSKFLDYL